MIKWHSGSSSSFKERKLRKMRNYVKEMDFIIEKKNPPANFCLSLLGATFFIAYSAALLGQEYYQFLLFLIVLALLFPFYAEFRFSLSEDEKALWNEIREARQFLEESDRKAGNAEINALVSFFHLKSEEMDWGGINGMLSDGEYAKEALKQAANKERQKLW